MGRGLPRWSLGSLGSLQRGVLSAGRRLPRWSVRAVWWAAAAAWLLAGVSWGTCGLRGCPDPAELVAYQPESAPVLLDRDGRAFARLMPVDHRVVPIDSLPAYVAPAFVAVEDHRFFRHGGVDAVRVLGAALRDVRSGGYEEGASTITMQLARNLFPQRLAARQRTLRRKLFEARVALGIERRFSKREILELYLNHIYFGDGAYGIDAASRDYFDRPASRLTLSQAAVLAGVVRRPGYYDPRERPDAVRRRRDLVLGLMARQGWITAERARSAAQAELAVADAHASSAGPFAAYYVDEVRGVLERRFGEKLYGTGLRVRTTLDAKAQRAAESELADQLRAVERGRYGRLRAPKYGAAGGLDASGTRYLQGAVVVLQARTGDVLALVGGRDHRQSRFDRAVAGRRQVGSAFKPFVYAAALRAGFAPTQPVMDEPIAVRLSAHRVWRPTNYEGDYEGLVDLRHALVHSRNVPTVRLAQAVGVDPIAQIARDAGVTADIPRQPSMALGTVSLSPLELTAAYTAFANLGERVAPRFVVSVEDSTGEELWRPPIRREEALDPAVAYVLTDILRQVVDRGTGRAVRSAGFWGTAAGKTGTTSDAKDAWFVGYTPDVVAGVWIGFDQPRPILAHASGGVLAAPVWGRLVRRITDAGSAYDDWRVPDGVVYRDVDPASGATVEQGCGTEYGDVPLRVPFVRGSVPDAVCPRPRSAGGWFSRVFHDIFGRGDDRAEEDRYDLTPVTALGRTLGARILPGTVDGGEPGADEGRGVRISSR